MDTPDILSRMIELVRALHPDLSAEQCQRIESDLRAEFRGETVRIASRDRVRLRLEVRARFNGRNATEVARELGIGRATVYRLVKTSGDDLSD